MAKTYPYFKVYKVLAGGIYTTTTFPKEYKTVEELIDSVIEYTKSRSIDKLAKYGFEQYCIQAYTAPYKATIIKLFTFKEILNNITQQNENI